MGDPDASCTSVHNSTSMKAGRVITVQWKSVAVYVSFWWGEMNGD